MEKGRESRVVLLRATIRILAASVLTSFRIHSDPLFLRRTHGLSSVRPPGPGGTSVN
jgi:hypothetical protein